jgi:hypothetical protein
MDFEDPLYEDNQLGDKWRQLFNKFDSDGFGEICLSHLPLLLEDGVGCGYISEDGASHFLERVAGLRFREANEVDETVSFQKVIELLTRKRSLSLKCALHYRDRQVEETENIYLSPEALSSASACRVLLGGGGGCKQTWTHKTKQLLAKHILTDRIVVPSGGGINNLKGFKSFLYRPEKLGNNLTPHIFTRCHKVAPGIHRNYKSPSTPPSHTRFRIL